MSNIVRKLQQQTQPRQVYLYPLFPTHRRAVHLRGGGARAGRGVANGAAVRLLRLRTGSVGTDEPHRLSAVPHVCVHGEIRARPVLSGARLSAE